MKNPGLGEKQIVLGQSIVIEQVDAQALKIGEEITLLNWGNTHVRNIIKDENGTEVTSVELELHLEGDVKKTKKITWLAVSETNLVPVDLVSFDYLITKDKLDKKDRVEDFLTPVTESRVEAFADCNVTALEQGAIVQLEREGYYRLDAPYTCRGSKMVFFDVPSGKSCA